MYGCKVWALRKVEQQNSLERIELRMLKWMMRITRLTRKNRAENVEMDDENNKTH